MAVHDLTNDVSESPRSSPLSWRDDSVCRQHPTQWWFAGNQSESARAKAICADCVVRAPCLEFALSRPDLVGIWAATTQSERTTLRRDGRTDAAAGTPLPALDAVEIAVEPVVATVVAPPVVVDLVAEQEVDAGADAEAAGEPDPLPMRKSRRGPRRGWRDGVVGEQAELLTPAEAARKLGVTPNTVTRWSRAGKISAIQTMGGHRRFRRAEIDRVLREAGVAAPTPY
jgi:excisionase family DNA binding protein